MGNDVIIGYDGTPRCAWTGATDTALGCYVEDFCAKYGAQNIEAYYPNRRGAAPLIATGKAP
jgi:hypothetical protein